MPCKYNHWSAVSRGVVIVALATVLVCPPRAADAASTPQPIAKECLRVDNGLLTAASSDDAQGRLIDLVSQFDACRNSRSDSDAALNCLRMLLGGGNAEAANEPSSPRESTLTGLLLDRRGNCAALVALALSLAPSDWDAFVLRDHVTLVTRTDPRTHLELTDRAREISSRELQNRFGAQLESAVVVSANRFPAYYLDNLAVRLAREGRDADAERLFREAIANGSHEARPRFNYGTFLLDRGRSKEAAAHLKVATRRAPKNADAWTNLGVAYAKVGKSSRAVDAFERAIQLEPGNQTALSNLAAIKTADGRHTKPN